MGQHSNHCPLFRKTMWPSPSASTAFPKWSSSSSKVSKNWEELGRQKSSLNDIILSILFFFLLCPNNNSFIKQNKNKAVESLSFPYLYSVVYTMYSLCICVLLLSGMCVDLSKRSSSNRRGQVIGFVVPPQAAGPSCQRIRGLREVLVVRGWNGGSEVARGQRGRCVINTGVMASPPFVLKPQKEPEDHKGHTYKCTVKVFGIYQYISFFFSCFWKVFSNGRK